VSGEICKVAAKAVQLPCAVLQQSDFSRKPPKKSNAQGLETLPIQSMALNIDHRLDQVVTVLWTGPQIALTLEGVPIAQPAL
jgi:hypothetical protein